MVPRKPWLEIALPLMVGHPMEENRNSQHEEKYSDVISCEKGENNGINSFQNEDKVPILVEKQEHRKQTFHEVIPDTPIPSSKEDLNSQSENVSHDSNQTINYVNSTLPHDGQDVLGNVVHPTSQEHIQSSM